MKCLERLQQYFKDNGVAFDVRRHRVAYTAQEIAAAEHVPGRLLAKVVIAKLDEETAMVVVPATHRVDFEKVKALTGARSARLAKEEEFAGIFPDCEVGAMPPFGNLYNIPVYVDSSLAEDPEIVFQAGTHAETMKIRYADFKRLVQPKEGVCATHA